MSARIKMPAGTGVWPAFWMLGDSLNKTITWPDCGEIDIVESKDNPNTMVFGTAHGPGYSGGGGLGDVISSSTPLSAGYHTYAIKWKKDRIDWYFDGALFHTIVPSDTYGKPWVFNQEFFLIMNLAMGGMFVGNPSFSQVNPVNSATMSIDWIRYYSVNGLGRVIKH
jgi:beta-glucanase (GH16 family)